LPEVVGFFGLGLMLGLVVEFGLTIGGGLVVTLGFLIKFASVFERGG
jgi:hypothetical protein